MELKHWRTYDWEMYKFSWWHGTKSGTNFLKRFVSNVPASSGHVKKNATKSLKTALVPTPSGRQKTWCQATLYHLSQSPGWYLSTALHRHYQLAKYHPVLWLRCHNVSWHEVVCLPEGWCSIFRNPGYEVFILNFTKVKLWKFMWNGSIIMPIKPAKAG